MAVKLELASDASIAPIAAISIEALVSSRESLTDFPWRRNTSSALATASVVDPTDWAN